MSFYILGAGGEPQPSDLATWARWLEDANRSIAFEQVGDVEISTMFVGIGGPAPCLFETMVFGGPLDGQQTRCSTKAGALEAHRRAVAAVRANPRSTKLQVIVVQDVTRAYFKD